MKQLASFKPWFIEEPTSPDDILGHKAIREALKPLGIGVATGEMCQNRVIFKQLLASGAIDICQIDACRMGGVNEVMAVMLMAKKYVRPIACSMRYLLMLQYLDSMSQLSHTLVEWASRNTHSTSAQSTTSVFPVNHQSSSTSTISTSTSSILR